jgi:hypothetical protein
MFGYETWLDFLWHRPADPTRDWSISDQPLPTIRLEPFSIGNFQFGDPIVSAEFLGRPERCRRFRTADNAMLLYGRRGMMIEFDEGKFAEVLFHIGDGTYSAPLPGAMFCRPRIEGRGELTNATKVDEFIRIVGEPQRIDSDEDDGEVILYYANPAVCMEAEFNPQGTLGAWTVMVNDELCAG